MQFSPLDLLVVAILIRCILVGKKKGLKVEVFKTLGMLFAIFLTLHYYVICGKAVVRMLTMPEAVAYSTAFILLWILSVSLFELARENWFMMFHQEEQPRILHGPGAVLGGVRGMLVASITIILILVTQNPVMRVQVAKSFSGDVLSHLSPSIYRAAFSGVLVLFPHERINGHVFEAVSGEDEDKDANGDAAKAAVKK